MSRYCLVQYNTCEPALIRAVARQFVLLPGSCSASRSDANPRAPSFQARA